MRLGTVGVQLLRADVLVGGASERSATFAGELRAGKPASVSAVSIRTARTGSLSSGAIAFALALGSVFDMA